ncbi:MAG TPA: PRC-barrel domain-containing protein [Candidatus Acidoferrales bacterium]|nr:PRC-barrel domain-containing protein [Candidatus Acidoferrales bacterium]
MAHYGTLRDTQFADATEDIRGSHLYGLDDEKLGKIDDVIFDHSSGVIRYIVVDTGGWLSTKRFIVPADRLRASAKHNDDFEVPLDKQQIENFPPYQESGLDSESKWASYEDRYRSKWETGPVMHREGTDRNITPTTSQIPGNSPSAAAAAEVHGWPARARATPNEFTSESADIEAAAAQSERVVPAGTDTVVISNSAVGIGGRWDTFQSRLRERRKQAVTGCSTCSGDSAAKRGSESADTLRKAV